MPPPVEEWSDEESGDIPFTTAPEVNDDAKNGNEEDGSDDSDEEGVFIVEEIKNHAFDLDGPLMLHVKWKGYDDDADLTWETEENLKDGAEEVLDAYYKKIGGRPEKPKPSRKRKSTAEKKETPPTKPTETKRRRQTTPKNGSKNYIKTEDQTPTETEEDEPSDWVPKGRNWDEEVQSVDTIIRDANDQGLYALILWTNGKRSRINIESCYEKCPMKMLKFYEKHLVFKDG